jgi:hypothetical protein
LKIKTKIFLIMFILDIKFGGVMNKYKFLLTIMIIFFLSIIVNAQEFRTVTSGPGLRMRDKPDISGKIITTIPDKEIVDVLEEKGATLTISGATGRWCKVKWYDNTGWVFGGFLIYSSMDYSGFNFIGRWGDSDPDQEGEGGGSQEIMFYKSGKVIIRGTVGGSEGTWGYDQSAKKISLYDLENFDGEGESSFIGTCTFKVVIISDDTVILDGNYDYPIIGTLWRISNDPDR